MTAIEKLRKLLNGKMPNGKTRAEACADSFVNCALTIGDCAELLQEIDRLRIEAANGNAVGYCDRCNRWSNEISLDEETGADLCEECQFKADEERENSP